MPLILSPPTLLQRPPGPRTDGLKQLATENLRPGTQMVEIGSHQGESARIFIETGLIGEITCVDPLSDVFAPDFAAHPEWSSVNDWEKCEAWIKEALTLAPKGDFIRKPGALVAINWPERSLDFVYIDGLHEYESVKQDIEVWLPKIRAGGIIAGHDYNAGFPGVERAVKEVLGGPHRLYPDTSWLWFKPIDHHPV